jgi:hypothetical protein
METLMIQWVNFKLGGYSNERNRQKCCKYPREVVPFESTSTVRHCCLENSRDHWYNYLAINVH